MIFSSKSASLCPCVHSHVLPFPFHLPVGVIRDWRQQASCACFNLSLLSSCIGVTARLEQMLFSPPLLNIHFAFLLGFTSRKNPRRHIRYKGDLKGGRWQDTKEIGSYSASFGKGQMWLGRSNQFPFTVSYRQEPQPHGKVFLGRNDLVYSHILGVLHRA